jgi:hypothetical protein
VITHDTSSPNVDYDAVLARIFPPPRTPPRLANLSAGATPLVIDFCAAYVAEPGPVTSRSGAGARLQVKATQEIKYEHAGLIDSFLDGTARRVSVASIYRLLISRAIASHPVGGPPARARFPAGRYAKKPRPRKPAELEGLRKGNERRRLDAQARRAMAKEAEAAS